MPLEIFPEDPAIKSLTKRDVFAMVAMHAIIQATYQPTKLDPFDNLPDAMKYADAMLAALYPKDASR